jgi:hypothetical protein
VASGTASSKRMDGNMGPPRDQRAAHYTLMHARFALALLARHPLTGDQAER